MQQEPTSHQTVRLERGRHQSAQHGVCAMELASMLAGETFSDRPASVCPVIAAFVRAYNDAVDRRRRQDLYRVAAEVVGSRATRAIEQERLRRCVQAAEDCLRTRPPWRRRLSLPGLLAPGTDDVVAWRVARLLKRDGDRGHARALALVDELLAVGTPAPQEAPSRPVPALS